MLCVCVIPAVMVKIAHTRVCPYHGSPYHHIFDVIYNINHLGRGEGTAAVKVKVTHACVCMAVPAIKSLLLFMILTVQGLVLLFGPVPHLSSRCRLVCSTWNCPAVLGGESACLPLLSFPKRHASVFRLTLQLSPSLYPAA